MRIFLVTSNYWPEPTGIAVYTTDLAESLTTQGDQVTVLTSLPHYPWWRVPSEFAHLGEGTGTHNGVSIIRAKHLVPPKMNALMRMRFETSLWWNLRRVSKSMVGNDFDMVIACIPTVAAGIVGKRIAKKLRIPFGLIVQDLSGAGAKQSGLRGGAVISKIAHFVEGRALHGADSLVVVSPAMRDVVFGLGVPESRITQITNYSARAILNVDKASARSRFGWAADDFVVIHTGNMGAKQDLENVVRAADAVNGFSKIKIYLVGHGNQESNLKALCSGKSNIAVLPAVSDADYSALLSAADLLLVNERSTQMEMSLPSKLTSYLYSERPVIAAVPRGGATWKFLDGVAELVEAADPVALARAIEELSKQPEKLADLARRGREFADANLDPEVGRKKYLDWVQKLIGSK
ncbi:glycosyltransferase family 4 protein [Candidatus Planktophila dulcis]|uniref:glycosyltransferase family 4 protein n=1 Tax=Candidatus Planktophila dulcis TaxID=1884914 RepID=UPI003CF91710